MNYTVKEVHISTIIPGDTIMHGGTMVTVNKNNIKSGFMGTTLFGDSYNAGHIPVKKVIFNRVLPKK